MNYHQTGSVDNNGRDRSATFGMQNDTIFINDRSGHQPSPSTGQPNNYEAYLSKYEYLRLKYENEGISQQSLLLLRRLSKIFHTQDSELTNLPVLKSMISVWKKLMLNDFEILIWAIYLKETALNRDDLIDYLDVSAMFVKKDLNESDVFKIFETFLAHNHHNVYNKYANSSKPQVTLTLKRINYFHMTLLEPFEQHKDKEIQDFNYEVDALEDEHVRREVHTTKVVIDEETEQKAKNEQSENSYANASNKDTNKRTRKAKGRGKLEATSPIKNTIKNEIEKPKYSSLQNKRESKKSFDLFNNEDQSDNNGENPFFNETKFEEGALRNIPEPKMSTQKRPMFNPFGAISNKPGIDKMKEGNKFSFAASSTHLPPAIPPPFKKPMMSMESYNGFGGGFDHHDDIYMNALGKSTERLAQTSRDFMERNHQEQIDPKQTSQMFKSFTPYSSGEFGKLFDNENDQPRNLLHPTPKYQK